MLRRPELPPGLLGEAVQFLQRFGKPELSVEQYAPRLRAVLLELTTEPELPTPEVGDMDSIKRFLEAQSRLFERLNSRRLEFEQVKPDRRLIPLHDKTMVLCRMTLKVWNLSAEQLDAALKGDFATRARKTREMDSWGETLLATWRQERALLLKVQSEQPTLFALLELPDSVLNAIRSV
jgi:hypothetical protein